MSEQTEAPELQWETVETDNDEPGYFQRLRLEHGYLYCRYNGPHLAMAFVPDAPAVREEPDKPKEPEKVWGNVCPPHSDEQILVDGVLHVRCRFCGRVRKVL